MSCYTLHIVIGCRKIFGNGLTYNILGFSVYLYHFHTPQKMATKKEAIDLIASVKSLFLPMSYIRHPYVGIIQIRFSVEGHTFLSACLQAPVCSVVSILCTFFI